MRNVIKCIGIVAVAAIIAIGFFACGDGDDGGFIGDENWLRFASIIENDGDVEYDEDLIADFGAYFPDGYFDDFAAKGEIDDDDLAEAGGADDEFELLIAKTSYTRNVRAYYPFPGDNAIVKQTSSDGTERWYVGEVFDFNSSGAIGITLDNGTLVYIEITDGKWRSFRGTRFSLRSDKTWPVKVKLYPKPNIDTTPIDPATVNEQKIIGAWLMESGGTDGELSGGGVTFGPDGKYFDVVLSYDGLTGTWIYSGTEPVGTWRSIADQLFITYDETHEVKARYYGIDYSGNLLRIFYGPEKIEAETFRRG